MRKKKAICSRLMHYFVCYLKNMALLITFDKFQLGKLNARKILPLQIPGDLPRVLVEALRTGNASLKINDIYISIITFGSFYCYISLYTEKLEIENLKCSYYYINPYVRVGNILSLFQQSKRIFHKYNVPGRKLDINRSLLVFHLLQLCNYYLCFFFIEYMNGDISTHAGREVISYPTRGIFKNLLSRPNSLIVYVHVDIVDSV